MKRLLLSLMTLVIVIHSFGQKLMPGAQVGISFIPYSKTELNGQQYAMGWNAGIGADFVVSPGFSFSPEINYNLALKSEEFMEKTSFFDFLQGLLENELGNLLPDSIDINDFFSIDSLLTGVAGFVDDTVYSTTSRHHSLSYLEIPLLVTYKYRKVRLSGGPYIGILIGSTTTELFQQKIPLLEAMPGVLNTGDPLSDLLINGVIKTTFPGFKNEKIETISTTQLESLDFGVIVSLAADIGKNIFAGLRYSHGFREYLQNPTKENDFHSSIRFFLGFRLNLEGKAVPVYQ
ncbi:MAG: PorT family protein [Bacteroidetes bacterium]|nr:PorT family protein [Bacteroidota bacterium]MBU1718780.1 PorT family protein [Bacteroidota bacterium]